MTIRSWIGNSRGRPGTKWRVRWMPAMAAAAAVFSAATAFAQGIISDKLSYQPGETVTVTGEGWQPQEQVSVVITNSSGNRASFSATAGTVGSFRSEAFVAQESDRRQLFFLTARGQVAGAEASLAFSVGAAPGFLRCSTLATADTSHFGIDPGQRVTCTIEQATDLSAAQQAGLEPVEVQVRSRLLGNEQATVLSVNGSTITFEYTAPLNAAGSSTVSYGPVKACDPASTKCGTFPTAGNDANSTLLSGGSSAAGFQYLAGPQEPSCVPNLKVVVQPENGAFVQGSQVTFTIVVSNPAATGSNAATGVSLVDELPDQGGMVWETVTTTQGSCSLANNMLQCSLGDLAPQASVYVKVTSSATTPILACRYQPNRKAVATADGGLKVEASGALTCTPRAQISVIESPHAGTFNQGGQATFTIVVSNPAPAGAATANNARLRDELPIRGGMSWTPAQTTQGVCWFTGIASNILNCSLGSLQPGASATVTVSTPATTPVLACTSQPKPAAVATADGDGLIAQDAGYLNCTPTIPTELSLEKTPDGGTYMVNDQLLFLYVVRNTSATGAAAATNVQLIDQLPANGGLTWRNVSTQKGTCSITDNRLSCSLGSMATGESVKVAVYILPVPLTGCTTVSSTAVVTADGGVRAEDAGSATCIPAVTDGNVGSGGAGGSGGSDERETSGEEETGCAGTACLSLVKGASTATPQPGEAVTYSYTVRNSGDVPVQNITVTDDNGTPHNPKDDVIVGTIATLAPGASTRLTASLIPSRSSVVAALGSAGPSSYAVLSLGGDAQHPTAGINCSNGTVSGDVAIAGSGKFSNAAPCLVTGNFVKGAAVTYKGPGKLAGATRTEDALLTTLRTSVFNAAGYFAGLPATPSVQAQFPASGAISGTRTVTGGAGINVVNLNGLRLNGNLTLTGPAGTQFVLNISGDFDLHSGNITTGGGVGPYDVVYNITNGAALVKTMVPTTAVGILLAPYNAITPMDSAKFYGQIIGGYNKVITLMSATKVVPPAAPPPYVTNTATASNGAVSVKAKVTVVVTSNPATPPPPPDTNWRWN